MSSILYPGAKTVEGTTTVLFVICEAEIDFLTAEYKPEFVEFFKGLQETIRGIPRTPFKLPPDFPLEIDFSITEGSVKHKFFTLMTIVNLFSAIEHYGEVRHGLDQLWEDSRLLGKQVNFFVGSMTDMRKEYESPFTSQVRTGILGSLKRLKDDISFLSKNADDLSPNEIKQRAERIEADLDRIVASIANAEERSALDSIIAEILSAVAPRPDPSNILDKQPLSVNRGELESFLERLRRRSNWKS